MVGSANCDGGAYAPGSVQAGSAQARLAAQPGAAGMAGGAARPEPATTAHGRAAPDPGRPALVWIAAVGIVTAAAVMVAVSMAGPSLSVVAMPKPAAGPPWWIWRHPSPGLVP